MNRLLGDYHKSIFWATLLVTAAIITYGLAMPAQFEQLWLTLNQAVTVNFGWYYLLLINVLIIFSVWLMFSKYGKLRIGADDDRPEHSNFAWIAMLFSAGVGVGLVFWGVAEPILHFMETPYLVEPGSAEALRVSLAISTMHWGIHGWACFTIIGLAVGFAAYRLGKPMTVSGGLYGVLGERVHGNWGKAIDFFSAFATIAGISTTLGLGVMSVSYAANTLFGMENTLLLNVIIMALMVTVFLLSTGVGVKRGMSRLSTLNVYLSIAMMFLILLLGPTRFVLNSVVLNLGGYVSLLPYMSFWTDPVDQSGWLSWWTVFYWGWWLAWAPFVGGFIAKISKGRTVKQFVTGVLFVPTLLTILWFGILGGAAVHAQIAGVTDMYGAISAASQSGLYALFGAYPISTVLIFIVMLNMITFICTSADASAFYVAAVMNKGAIEPNPAMKILMGVVIGLVALVLLQSGGLKALQTMSVVAAFPFSFIMLASVFSIYKMLKKDYADTYGIIPEGEVTRDKDEAIAN